MSNNFPTMQYFRTVSSRFGGLAKGCRFLAKIEPSNTRLLLQNGSILNDLTYLCESTELPGRGFNSVEVRYFGPQHKLPFQSTFEDINMTFLTRANSAERKFFDDWINLINPVNNFTFAYRDNYKARIRIYQIPENKTSDSLLYQFVLNDAFPVLVNPQPVTWADDQFLRLGITFTYHWWERPRN
jgi:hypothetical protein